MSNESADPIKKWEGRAGLIGMIVGFIISLAGGLLWLGEWKANQEARINADAVRIDKLETYVPTIIGMQHDISYLADRARQEDQKGTR